MVKPFVNDRNVGIVVRVVRVKHILLVVEVGLIHFFKDLIGILLLLLLLLNDSFWSSDKIMKPAVNISQ